MCNPSPCRSEVAAARAAPLRIRWGRPDPRTPGVRCDAVSPADPLGSPQPTPQGSRCPNPLIQHRGGMFWNWPLPTSPSGSQIRLCPHLPSSWPRPLPHTLGPDSRGTTVPWMCTAAFHLCDLDEPVQSRPALPGRPFHTCSPLGLADTLLVFQNSLDGSSSRKPSLTPFFALRVA